MKSLYGIFANLASSLPSRVLASLGIGVISFAGFSALSSQLVTQLQTNWNNIGADTLAYISLAGFPTAFGMIAGAFVVKMTLAALPKLGRVTGA